MLEGLRTAAAGMLAQQQKLDAVSNDLANANTTGYKRVRVAFRDLLYTPQVLSTIRPMPYVLFSPMGTCGARRSISAASAM